MTYTTIKITTGQKKEIDVLRIPRPDIGKRVHERTVMLVVAELLEKSKKYDNLVRAK